MLKIKVAILASILVVAFACKKEFEQTPTPDPTRMSELKVAPDFNWKTFDDYQLQLSAGKNGLVTVLSPQGKVLQKAYLKQGQVYNMKLSLPAGQHTVKLMFIGQLVEINLTSGVNTFRFQ